MYRESCDKITLTLTLIVCCKGCDKVIASTFIDYIDKLDFVTSENDVALSWLLMTWLYHGS